MSYCRFAWDGSDVYVIDHTGGFIHCYCNNAFPDSSPEWEDGDAPERMIAHLAAHKRAGDFVPPDVITQLWDEVDGPSEAVKQEPIEMRALHANQWVLEYFAGYGDITEEQSKAAFAVYEAIKADEGKETIRSYAKAADKIFVPYTGPDEPYCGD